MSDPGPLGASPGDERLPPGEPAEPAARPADPRPVAPPAASRAPRATGIRPRGVARSRSAPRSAGGADLRTEPAVDPGRERRTVPPRRALAATALARAESAQAATVAPRGTPRGIAGWRVVAAKELADHLNAARLVVIAVILAIAAVAAVYVSAGYLRERALDATDTPEVFLFLFTFVDPEAQVSLPAFYALVGFLAPLLGIAFGFDAVSSERSQGTLPRLLAQPIHRDDLINGKFVAGLTVIGLIFAVLTALVAGVGIVRLGVVPTAEGAIRLVAWLGVTVVYVGFWLAFAMLCSVAFRRAATSALVAIGVWLALTLFGTLLAQLVANLIAPGGAAASSADQLRSLELQQTLARLSPNTLYQEATVVLLNPSVRSLGAFLPEQLDRAVTTFLPIEQSLLLVWIQIVVLVALTIVSFAVAYVLFLRQEVRA